MGSTIRTLLSAALLGGLPSMTLADIEVARTEDAELRLGGMGQLLGVGQEVHDPHRADERLYLFLKAARLRTTGRYQQLGFRVELALGGEELVAAPSPGVSAGLLDFSFRLGLGEASFVQFGQFKVPWGREALTYSGNTLFADRSIADLGFRVGRDVGLAFTTRPGPATVTLGVFTGGGRDLPQRYIPEKMGLPLVAVRAGLGNLEEDPYLLDQAGPAGEGTRAAFSVSGLYTRDSVVGHSSALNVKLADKSLLLQSAWNPYIARAPTSQGDWWQAGADAAIRTALGAWALTGEAEGSWGAFANRYGSIHLAAARVQAGLGRGPFTAAARYAALFPDQKLANGGFRITGEKPIHEIAPSLSWAFAGHMFKVIADLPVVLNTPVILEPRVGAYVATQHPDQASQLSKGSTVRRQTTASGRLLLQAQF